jgi:CubicO group peptidase (beta-lactamase class C family)
MRFDSSIRAFALVLAWSATVQPERALAAVAQEATSEKARLGTLLEEVRAAHDLPALGGAIVQGGEIVELGVAGVRAAGSSEKVTVDDLWHLGSCTKAMTATLAARLVEKGKLKFETTVGEAFPKLPSIDAAWKKVPIEWLLQNRGGVPGKPPEALWRELWGGTDPPREARRRFVEGLLALPPVEPGTKFEYSNQGFVVAGAMLESLSGSNWEELIRAELFEPLGMKSAGFGPPGKAGTIDQPRGHQAGKPVEPGPRADNPAAIGPAGTVHATLSDWARFAAAHLAGARGSSTFLKPETFARLQSPPEGQSYAMGWGAADRPWAGGKTLTHSGSNTMWFCVVWIAPEKDHAFLVTCNSASEAAPKACDEAVGKMIALRKLP